MTKKTTTTALPVDPVAEAERRLAAAEREIADIEARQKRLADLQRQSAELRASLMDARAAVQAAGTVDAASDHEAAEKLKAARLEGARLALELEDTDAAAARAIQRRQEAAAAAEKERKAARLNEARVLWKKRVEAAKVVDQRLAELTAALQEFKQSGLDLWGRYGDVLRERGTFHEVVLGRHRVEMAACIFGPALYETLGLSLVMSQHAQPLAGSEQSILNNVLGADTTSPAAPDSKPVVATSTRPAPTVSAPVTPAVPVDLADDANDPRTVFERR